MAKDKLADAIDDLFRRSRWAAARERLQRERAKDPNNHWVLTQLGVTFYEDRRYREALPLFLESLAIVPDCPLTLWHLAGTLDALGKAAKARDIYVWLLESDKSPEDDPCWESEEWTIALKVDCTYRLALCFKHLGKNRSAALWFRQYVTLLSDGFDGSYSAEDALSQIRSLQGAVVNGGAEHELRKAVGAALRASGIRPRSGRRQTPPVLNVRKLLPGRPLTGRR